MLRGQHSRRKVISRVLSALPLLASDGWTFIWEHCCQCPRAVSLEIHAREQRVKINFKDFPMTFHQVGFTVPHLSPNARCALTAPFHPFRQVFPIPQETKHSQKVSAKRWFIFCDTILQVALTGC